LGEQSTDPESCRLSLGSEQYRLHLVGSLPLEAGPEAKDHYVGVRTSSAALLLGLLIKEKPSRDLVSSRVLQSNLKKQEFAKQLPLLVNSVGTHRTGKDLFLRGRLIS